MSKTTTQCEGTDLCFSSPEMSQTGRYRENLVSTENCT